MVRIVENKIISKFQKLDEYLTNLAQLKKEIKSEKNFLEDFFGFRNILVHEYGEIDRKKVYEVLQTQTKDLKEFKQEILKFIKNN